MRQKTEPDVPQMQPKPDSRQDSPHENDTHPKKILASISMWPGVLLASIKHVRRHRVPFVTQMNGVECGAACLAMVLSYYGRLTQVAEIRRRYNIGRDGLSALSIAQAARHYGLHVRAVSCQQNNLSGVRVPAIVHWEFNHFIVLEYWTPEYVDVLDPAAGRKRLTTQEFDDGFTGVLMMLEPTVDFSLKAEKQTFTLRSYGMQYLRHVPGILVQILLASLLLQVLGLSVPLLTEVIVDKILPLHLTSVMPVLGLGMIVLVVAQGLVLLLRAWLVIYLQNRIDVQMIPKFFEHLLHLPLNFFQQRSSGDILTRIASNTTVRQIISTQLVSNLLDGGTVIVYIIILCWQSWSFGLLVLVIACLHILLMLGSNSTMRRYSRLELEAMGMTQGYVTELLTAIETVKSSGYEGQAFRQWSSFFYQQLNISNRRNSFSALISTSMLVLEILAPLFLLWLGAIQVLNGTLALGTMLALNALAILFLVPLTSLVSSMMQLQVVRTHIDRIGDVYEADAEQDVQVVGTPPVLTGRIKIDRVSFQYNPQLPNVLTEISLDIKPGQKVAIVGQTGSGKSTLGKLLLGLHTPTTGEIRYNNVPLQKMNYQAVREQLGVVIQEAGIFGGSIRQNIAFAHKDATMQQIMLAASRACMHEDIVAMPMRYETFVAEGGNALSGGQRQRLALARALVHNPRILFMDEATSSLDVATERAVERNLNQLACTQIIIAHRLSTVRNADLIVVLDKGCIVERGSHQELLHKNGYYATLVQYQMEQNAL